MPHAVVAPAMPWLTLLVRRMGSSDHFERMGLQRSFDVDYVQLKKRYQDLQRASHPDLLAAAGSGDGVAAQGSAEAEVESAQINEGYAILADPLRRAEYLLALHGQPITEKDHGNTVDPSLLMEVMEWREEIEEAQQEAQPEVVEALTKDFRTRQDDAIAAVGKAFALTLADGECDPQLDQARNATIRLKYVRRAVEELECLLPAA